MIYLKEPNTNRIVEFENEVSIGAGFANWSKLAESEILDYEFQGAKDKKKAEIKALRDNNLLLPTPLTIELGGLNKQFNVKSVDLLMFGTIITVLSQSEGSTRSWQAGDGVRYELTVNDYRSLVNHLISRDELEFFQAKLKIAALSLLNTVEEIEAFDINEIIIS